MANFPPFVVHQSVNLTVRTWTQDVRELTGGGYEKSTGESGSLLIRVSEEHGRLCHAAKRNNQARRKQQQGCGTDLPLHNIQHRQTSNLTEQPTIHENQEQYSTEQQGNVLRVLTMAPPADAMVSSVLPSVLLALLRL